jgi:hypothetical protein
MNERCGRKNAARLFESGDSFVGARLQKMHSPDLEIPKGDVGFARAEADGPRDLVLQVEQVTNVAVKLVGPDLRVGVGPDQLRGDADPVGRPLDASFEHNIARPVLVRSA